MRLTLLIPQHGHDFVHEGICCECQVLSESILVRDVFRALTVAITVQLGQLILVLLKLRSLMLKAVECSQVVCSYYSLLINAVHARLGEICVLLSLRCHSIMGGFLSIFC